MNADSQLTNDQLRLATTRNAKAETGEQPETAADRKAFLSFGAAVEAAAGDFDEAALISRLKECELPCPASEKIAVTPSTSRHGWWLVIACGALPATVLFAVGRIVLLPPDNTIESSRETDLPDVNEGPGMGLASIWHDPLDDELALAAATIEQLATRRSFDGSLWQVGQRLDALSEELSHESL